MPIRQKYLPNVVQPAVRGWCLKYIDDAGKLPNTAPPRRSNARAALDAEIAAKRLKSGNPPVGIWVVGYLDLRTGAYAKDDHVFFMRRNGDGSFDIHDSETNGGGRGVYHSIAEIVAWFGKYAPMYVGYSYVCDTRVYAEDFANPVPKPAAPTRVARKSTFTVGVTALNVRSAPDAKKGKIVATYKKGQKFNYDSYVVANGFVWLSYISNTGQRRYVAEGPYDGNLKNVYGPGGVKEEYIMVETSVLIPIVIIAITQMLKMANPQIKGWATIVVAFVVALVVSIASFLLPTEVIGIPKTSIGMAIFDALVAIGITASAAKAGGGASGDNGQPA